MKTTPTNGTRRTAPTTITRTIMILDWNQHTDIAYLTFEKDLSRLDRVYVTSEFSQDVRESELSDLLFDSNGNFLHKTAFAEFPHEFYIPGQTAVIIAGLAP